MQSPMLLAPDRTRTAGCAASPQTAFVGGLITGFTERACWPCRQTCGRMYIADEECSACCCSAWPKP